MIIREHYLAQIRPFYDSDLIKIITGIRRCGKSHLLFRLFKSHLLESGVQKGRIIEVDLERRDSARLRDPIALGDYIRSRIRDSRSWTYVLIDEIQLCRRVLQPGTDLSRIHPDDREAYHKGIDEIFSGNTFGHDMQYRAKKPDGTYDVCTCRGVVIRDNLGEPDYFVGTIRNHGSQGTIDTLTGLRNQYGFFEDLETWIKRKAECYVLIVGISKFSEINEVYGYHFGNRVLQLYARKVFETTGNTGSCYRIDGTKFAVISNSLDFDEIETR